MGLVKGGVRSLDYSHSAVVDCMCVSSASATSSSRRPTGTTALILLLLSQE